MQRRRLVYYGKLILLLGVVIASGATTALAQTSSSSNYQVTESQFSSGSTLKSCSGQYCARASIGDITGGKSKSPGATATFGPVTTGEPLLEVIVQDGESDLGILSTEKTSTKTMTVQVRNYLSDGYTVQIVGDAPKYNGHKLKTPKNPTASKPGVEQFALNVAANTAPSVGVAPLQVPSAQTSFGVAEEAYRTPNLFKYVDGDVIARSVSESGQTKYTISMIINVASTTPAGHYTGDFAAIVMPIY